MTRTLVDVLSAAERRLLVAWLIEVAADLGSFYDAIDVLREASDLAAWAIACCVPTSPACIRASVLATALATDPEAVEAVAANALRQFGGFPVARWTEPRPEPGTRDRLRARSTCERFGARGEEGLDVAPVERHEDTRQRHAIERSAALDASRAARDERRRTIPDRAAKAEAAYLDAALSTACAELAAMVPGSGRHNELNRKAWLLGRLDGLDHEGAARALAAAGIASGLDARDAESVVRRALAKGAEQPRSVPIPDSADGR